jgi:hypothetical protein
MQWPNGGFHLRQALPQKSSFEKVQVARGFVASNLVKPRFRGTPVQMQQLDTNSESI